MDFDVYVLSPDMEMLGLVNQLTALKWTERSTDFGGFELWTPLTSENAQLLMPDNLIWIGGDSIGVIETLEKQKDEEGNKTLTVSGRFVEQWLERRIVWTKYAQEAPVSTHMRNMVQENAITGVRKLPNVVLADTQTQLGPTITFSANRDNLWETLVALGNVYNLRPRLVADIPAAKCKFKVFANTDRSLEQTANTPIVLSSELSDILSMSYSADNTAYKTTALVAGAGEGEARKTSVVNENLTATVRRELYVDARDLSDTETWDAEITTTISNGGQVGHFTPDGEFVSEGYRKITTVTKKLTHPTTGEVRTSSETTTEIVSSAPEASSNTEETTEEVPFPDEVYQAMLQERGRSKLEECRKVQAFDAQVRMVGARAYTYGEDYFLGDRITVEDKDLLLRVSAEVSEVEQSWDESNYSVVLTLGTSAPTITQLIRKAVQ